MSKNSPTPVETDPKQIEILEGTLSSAVHEYNQILIQYHGREHSPKRKRLLLDLLESNAAKIIEFAVKGDYPKNPLPLPYNWLEKNQALIEGLIKKSPNEIQSIFANALATVNAQSQPEPTVQPQMTQPTTNPKRPLIDKAKTLYEFISILESSDYTMTNPEAKHAMINNMRNITKDPESLRKLVEQYNFPESFLDAASITTEHGIRDKFVELSRQQVNNEKQLTEAVGNSKTIDELIRIIQRFPAPVLNADNSPADKNRIGINLFSLQGEILGLRQTVIDRPNEQLKQMLFGGAGIPERYGIQEKFVELAKHQFKSEDKFRQDVKNATTIEELIDKIEKFPYPLNTVAGGVEVNKETMTTLLHFLNNDPSTIQEIIRTGNFNDNIITSQFGIRSKFIEIVKEKNKITTEATQHQSTPVVKPPANIQKLNQIFGKNTEELTREYSDLRRGTGKIGWLQYKGKIVANAFTDKGKIRQNQIKGISQVFEMLKNDDMISPTQKAQIAHAYLANMKEQVGQENNTFTPGMTKLCEKYMAEIKGAAGQDNINPRDKNFIQDKLKEIEKLVNPEESPRSNKASVNKK